MRSPALLVAGLLAGSLLVACSGDGDSRAAAPGRASPSTEPYRSPSPSPPATLAAASESPEASPSTAPAPAAPAAPAPPAARAVRLTGDGVDTGAAVVEFGQSYEEAAPRLRSVLGAPTRDAGEESSFSAYGTCPGTRLRALEFGNGALHVLFGDVEGSGLTMYQWALTQKGTPGAVPMASALVGDTATFEFGVGDTLAELRTGSQGAELDVFPGDEVFGPSFRLKDQSSGLFGYLTGTTDRDTVTGVQGGEGCGE